MRSRLFSFICSRLQEGQILPWWALAAHWALYPLQAFYFRMDRYHGYQWRTDTWRIEGVTYSAEALRRLARAQGETYRITRIGEVVTLERVKFGAGGTTLERPNA